MSEAVTMEFGPWIEALKEQFAAATGDAAFAAKYVGDGEDFRSYYDDDTDPVTAAHEDMSCWEE